MRGLADARVIVTGGSQGIGYAIAERFVEEGADVAIANRSRDEGEAAADELGCRYVRCDVADWSDVQRLVDETVDAFGGLDCIVNNAGIARTDDVQTMTLEDWRAVISINLGGVLHGCKAAMPHLLESADAGPSSIVNVASIYGLVGGPGATAYSASKGGVVNLTNQIAVDYASRGVRCNGICPGFVETPMTDDYLDSEEFYAFVIDETPMDRVAQPEEIAGIAAFLASDDASYVTGANVPVDGGWTAH